MTGVWKELGFLFDTDDGSLPTVRVTGLSRDGLAGAYALLRSRARTSPDVAFWHRSLEREERLEAWPDAALLVADREADPFQFLASGLAFDGVALPDLGVFVWPDEVTLDYRMGSEWDERRVLALFELLRRLAALHLDARVTLGPPVLPVVERRFQSAFLAYCRQRIAVQPGVVMNPDPVKNFCRQRGYAEHVVRGGLEGLVTGWEGAVDCLLAAKPQYLCEYLNDLDKRQVLAESLEVAPPEQWQAVAARVLAADEAFIRGTVPVKECLRGNENAEGHGWTPAAHWWYFRKPKHYNFAW